MLPTFPLPPRVHARLRRVGPLLALVAIGLAVLPLSSTASPQSKIDALRGRIDSAKGLIQVKRGREQVLTGTISGFTRRIDTLQNGITRLQTRQDLLQGDLNVKLDQLIRTRVDLRAARERLGRLRARLVVGRRLLARRLVQLYEADRPDVVSVVLNAHGFNDLIESSAFLNVIGRQDRRVVRAVQAAKADAARLTRRLADLEDRRRRLVAAITVRRNEVAAVKGQLVRQRESYARQRAGKERVLGSMQASRQKVEQHVELLKGEERKIEDRIRAAAAAPAAGSGGGGGAAAPAGPIRSGGGSLIWPVNGPITSPFCERRAWEACHPGIDIGVGTGTPIRAAAAGSVTIAGPEGGEGNYTCLQHAGALSTCYAHQSSIGVSIGQRVSQGQVIGLVGCTGLCFGPHLHFEVRMNGSIVNPMNYL